MESTWYLALIPGLPLMGAVAIALLRNRWPRERLAFTASAAVGGSFAISLAALFALARMPADGYRALSQQLWHWLPVGDGLSLGLLADGLSVWFSLVVTGVGLMIHIYSAAYMESDRGFGRYFAELNYFIFAMSLLVLSDGFLGMLIGWANVGLASFLLIGFWHEKPEAQAAAVKAFVMNVGGEIGLILAAALLYTTFGSLRFADVFPQVAAAPRGVIDAIALLLLVGAVAKSAQLPLHTWLPDAMQGPTPVSALIHAATMVTAGVYLVARAFPIYEASVIGWQAVAFVGAASALYGAVVALGQNDVKRVLAFSTMSQVGYMILAAGSGAYIAALFHFLTHAFFKALLFLAAGMVIHHLDGEQDIRRMGGLGRRMPFPYWTFLIGTLALTGMPGLSGFFSKDEILVDLLLFGYSGYWIVGLITAGLTAFYMFRLFCLVFTGEPAVAASAHGERGTVSSAHAAPVAVEEIAAGGDAGHVGSAGSSGHEGDHGEDLRMAAPVSILAALSIAAGWIALPGLTAVPASFLGSVFHHFPGVAAVGRTVVVDAAVAKTWTVVIVTALAAVGAAGAVLRYGPRRTPVRVTDAAGWQAALAEGLFVDRFYRRVLLPPALRCADFCARVVDPAIIDGFIHGAAGLAQAGAAAIRRVHGGFLRRYALAVMAGTVLMLVYFAAL